MNIESYNPAGDYCTAWFDRLQFLWINWDWSHCCYEHDVAYTVLIPKQIADGALAECVYQTTGILGASIPVLMYLGVTIGGWWFYGLAAQRARQSK